MFCEMVRIVLLTCSQLDHTRKMMKESRELCVYGEAAPAAKGTMLYLLILSVMYCRSLEGCYQDYIPSTDQRHKEGLMVLALKS